MYSYRRELETQKRLLELIKENGCDMCIDDLKNGIITIEDLEKEEYKPIVSSPMGFERIILCKKHLLQLGKTISEYLNKNSYTTEPSRQTIIPNNGNKHMLPFSFYKKDIEKTKDEIESELSLRRLFKVDCCSKCATEAPCASDCFAPERTPVYNLFIGGRRILFCKNHLINFSKAIDDYIVENYPEEMTCIRK